MYEAGQTGFGLARAVLALGVEVVVVAPDATRADLKAGPVKARQRTASARSRARTVTGPGASSSADSIVRTDCTSRVVDARKAPPLESESSSVPGNLLDVVEQLDEGSPGIESKK